MRILVTGASGFLGRHILPVLDQTGIAIHGTSRNIAGLSSSIYWHQIDLLQESAVNELISTVQPTHLIHLAWDVTPGSYWTNLNNYNWVMASMRLLDSFRRFGGKRAVFAGTCAEYDWNNGYFVEDIHPLTENTPYGVCKASLYRMVMSYAKQTQLSVAWGRIFFPFGPYEHISRLVPYVINKLLQDEVAQTSSGEQIRDFMYVKDLASAFVAILMSEIQGAINISSGHPRPLRDVIDYIANSLDKMSLVELGARPDTGQPHMVAGAHLRLFNEVNWTPQYTLDAALDETIEWWKSKYSLNP